MRRLSKRPPKCGRHRASGQAVVYVNGADVYLGVCGSPKSHERYRVLWVYAPDEHKTEDREKSRQAYIGPQA
jgi:hypothetical protein